MLPSPLYRSVYPLVLATSVTYQCQFRNTITLLIRRSLIVITNDPQSYPACPDPSSSFANCPQLKKLDASAHPGYPILYRFHSKLTLPLGKLVFHCYVNRNWSRGCTVQIVAPPLWIHGPF